MSNRVIDPRAAERRRSILITIAAVAVLDDLRPVLAGLLGLAGMVLWCGRWFHARLGGYTGDTLGAVQQKAEIVFLVVAALFIGR